MTRPDDFYVLGRLATIYLQLGNEFISRKYRHETGERKVTWGERIVTWQEIEQMSQQLTPNGIAPNWSGTQRK